MNDYRGVLSAYQYGDSYLVLFLSYHKNQKCYQGYLGLDPGCVYYISIEMIKHNNVE